MISKNWFLDIKKSIAFLWFQKLIFWYKKIHFLISTNQFLDIKKLDWFVIKKWAWFFYFVMKWIYWYKKIDFFDIKKYIINSKTTPQLAVFNCFFLYSEIIFNKKNWIKKNPFLDIKILIFDLKKCGINSKTAPHKTFIN